MKAQMKQIQDTLDVMLLKTNNGTDSGDALDIEEDSIHGFIPVSDNGSLAKLEEKLVDNQFRKKLVGYGRAAVNNFILSF